MQNTVWLKKMFISRFSKKAFYGMVGVGGLNKRLKRFNDIRSVGDVLGELLLKKKERQI